MASEKPKKSDFLFEEIQNFRHWFTWSVILATLALMIGILLYQVFTGNTVGNTPASNGLLLGFIFIYYVPMIALMYYAKLTIHISHEAICFGWNIPNKDLQKIEWKDVAACEIITYRFTGYGYRLTKKYGIVYNTKGNKGLQLVKKSGEKILLGTLKAEELQSAINQLNAVAQKADKN
jgi:hypothetical protein